MKRFTWIGLAAALLLALACNDLEQTDLANGNGTIEGTVSGADGAPVGGAHVLVEGNLRLYATSDDEGAFRLEGVPAGPRRLLSYTPAGLGAALDVTVLAGEVTTAALSLAPTGTLAGAVTMAGADDHVGTLVYLLGTSFAAYTDHEGAYTMYFVVPGCYTLRAEHDGYAAKEVGPICVLRGEEKAVDEFTLLAGSAAPCSADEECPPHQACVEGVCLFDAGFGVEVCDGEDNDGDGLVDEGIVELCGRSEGVCEPGISLCLGGAQSPCLGAVGPGEEVCDNDLDDDCDGDVDENCAPGCGDGVCGPGEDGCTCAADCAAPECCEAADCPQPLCGACCVAVCGADRTCEDVWLTGCCGNGDCEAGENGTNCPEDCPVCGECGACEACDEGSGQCLAIPCVMECQTDEECGAGMRCDESVPGCCGECVPDDCVVEGDWYLPGDTAECCPGLVALPTGFGVFEGECAPLDCGMYDVCADCGDGVCGIGESFCTCPADCTGDCVGAGGVMVGGSGCCAGLDALPLGDGMTCLLTACTDCGDGTCGYGETAETCAADCCVPSCDGRECGDDGCGGSCGSCEAGCSCEAGMCLGGGSRPETLTPECVHVPPLVVAGSPFVIAVYGTTTGCTTFDEATGTLDGSTVEVSVRGSTSTCGPCPACLWSYAGMAWVTLPEPGPYTVSVGGATYPIVASGGIIEDPSCDDGCVPLDGDDWTLTFFTRQASSTACGGDLFEAATFGGSCQNYELTTGDVWTIPSSVYACTENQLYFGGDPSTEILPVTATRCDLPGGPAQEVILGVANYGAVGSRVGPELFVLERY